MSGPYKILLQNETYKKDVEEWEISMHEFLAEREVSDESLQEFMEAMQP